MGIKKYKPITPGRRFASVSDSRDLTRKKPEKTLTRTRKQTGGRNVQGKITVQHRGGGHKRKIRQIDFKQDKFNMPARVIALEYDPNRSARLALLEYKDKEKKYIIAPAGVKVSDDIVSSKDKVKIKIGNRMPLEHIPLGMMVHCVELEPGRGASIVRAAGMGATIMAVERGFAQLKMPSGEIRLVSKNCLATIGQVSHSEHRIVRLGKAGRKRWLGIRPTVRGKAKNPVDHPHGGGEGGQPIGLKHPKTPWGKPALGVRTRKKGKKSDKLIVKRRRNK